MKATTLKTLAKLAGVSKATVSLGLRDDSRVGLETRRRVKKLAERFNYHPSAVGRSMVSGRTMTIGVILPHIDFYYYGLMMSGVLEVISENNYCPLIYCTEHALEKEAVFLRRCIERRVEGIVIVSIHPTGNEKLFRELGETNIPFVLMDRKMPGLSGDYVGTDDQAGSRDAIRYLVSLGHRRIAHISGPQCFYNSKLRRLGYNEALLENGINPESKFLVEVPFRDTEAAKESVFHFLNLRPAPTAIFCDTDIQAAAAVLAITEKGLNVPRDISVVGFCDLDLARYFNPPLTTVNQPGKDVGKRAAQIIFQRIAEDKKRPKENSHPLFKPSEALLPTKLIIRRSTAPASK